MTDTDHEQQIRAPVGSPNERMVVIWVGDVYNGRGMNHRMIVISDAHLHCTDNIRTLLFWYSDIFHDVVLEFVCDVYTHRKQLHGHYHKCKRKQHRTNGGGLVAMATEDVMDG